MQFMITEDAYALITFFAAVNVYRDLCEDDEDETKNPDETREQQFEAAAHIFETYLAEPEVYIRINNFNK